MTSWSHGYNVSEGYTFGFYRETGPDWLDLALAFRGLVPPRTRSGQSFRYLELGCGQGLGLCLLAAANPEGEFVGIDFSPEHIAHADGLARAMGLTNVRFVEGDFAVLGASWPADYGAFDYAMLHGIYSWVPPAIRGSLVEILQAAVVPGGAVYVSYNAMPGWVSTIPFQHMLRLLETSGGLSGMEAIEAGRRLFAQLEGAGSAMTRLLPGLKSRIEGTEKQPAAYLVQEYLHENWHPMWCSRVMRELADAKLSLAASATLAENLLPAALPAPMQEVVSGQTRAEVREDTIDCLINQTFRRDIYVRGPRRLHQGDTAWRDEMRLWRLNQQPVPSDLSVKTSFGGIKLDDPAVLGVLEGLHERSLSIAEILALPAPSRHPARAQQGILLLLQAGWLGCGWQGEERRPPATQGNAAIARQASQGAPYRHLAAPALGSALTVSDSELVMLDSFLRNPGSAGFGLGESLRRLGRKLAKEGKPMDGQEEQAEIGRLEAVFAGQTLPLWKELGVIG